MRFFTYFFNLNKWIYLVKLEPLVSFLHDINVCTENYVLHVLPSPEGAADLWVTAKLLADGVV